MAISVEHKADGTDALYIAEGTSSQKELKANLGYIRFRTTEVIDSDSYGLVELVIRGATLQPQNLIQEGRIGSEKFMIVSLESSVHSAAAIFGSCGSPSFNIYCISGLLTWLSRGTLKARWKTYWSVSVACSLEVLGELRQGVGVTSKSP